jgi:hypothetical protein
MKFMNVKEDWTLYDTVAVSPYSDLLPHPIPGWYNSFAALGADDDISFFTSRNKSIGLAYNNQESRDQIPFALVAESISVSFIAPACSSQQGTSGSPAEGRVDAVSAFWAAELPGHASMVFRTNQDERLKTNVSMLPSGYGEVGFAMGQGDMSALDGVNGSVSCMGMGRSHLKYRWVFPTGIGIPKRATIGVSVRLVEWARTLLNSLWGPGSTLYKDSEQANVYVPSMFMIQVSVSGKRQVQQRAEYHA